MNTIFHHLEFKKMIACNFCKSSISPKYMYTQCGHLVCLACCSVRLDLSRRRVICCGMHTYVEHEFIPQIMASVDKRFNKQVKPIAEEARVKYRKEERKSIRESKFERLATEESEINEKIYASRTPKDANNSPNKKISKSLSMDKVGQDIKMKMQSIKARVLGEKNLPLSSSNQNYRDLPFKRPIIKKQKKERKTAGFVEINSPETEKDTREEILHHATKMEPRHDHLLRRIQLNEQRMRERLQRYLQIVN